MSFCNWKGYQKYLDTESKSKDNEAEQKIYTILSVTMVRGSQTLTI